MPYFLTGEELEQIKNELEQRVHTKRREISIRINHAKEQGDLSENAEYAAAKDEQAFNESRIQELELLIRTAQVVENKHKGVIEVGSQVKLKSKDGINKFTIVGHEGIDLAKGKISYESPLGKILIGKKVGDIIELAAPKGKIKYKIMEIK